MRWIRSTSAKSLQIRRYRRRLLSAQTHRRHLAPGFDESRIVNPRQQVSRRVARHAGGYGLPAHEMRQIRTVGAICRGACNGVAVDAGRLLEDTLSLGRLVSDVRWLLLLVNPSIEIFTRVDVYAQKHFGVLGSAVLRALPQIKSGLVGVHPHTVRVVWYKVRLSAQARHPEAVIRVRGKQREDCRSWLCR